jgi:hypothetical protein
MQAAIIRDASGFEVANTRSWNVDMYEANANLVAATPDLLAACFAAIEYCDKRADEETNELWGKLSFAVRKAIGETRT